MEPTQSSQPEQPLQNTPPEPALCLVCHTPLLPSYYFCPNCGKQIHEPPLPTGLGAQLPLYLFSITLPLIAFLFVTRWKGFKYLSQPSPQAKIIGMIATALLIGSTVASFWYAYHVTTIFVEKTMTEAGASLELLQGMSGTR
jgi:hypothetical protein